MKEKITTAIAELLRGREPDWDSLAELLQQGLAASPRAESTREESDIHIALALHEPDDASHWWNLAGQIAQGTELTKALLYLLAAEGFERESARGDGLTADEADWAESARRQAAWELLELGYFFAAAELSRSLESEDRLELTRELTKLQGTR